MAPLKGGPADYNTILTTSGTRAQAHTTKVEGERQRERERERERDREREREREKF